MSYLIAAAGTGGHVFPGLAVAQALVAEGIPRSGVVFVGGDRLEKTVYPAAGFDLFQVELRGLQRSLTLKNLTLPSVVLRARRAIAGEMKARGVSVALGMGGYATIPTALAARREGISLMVAEQNAGAGLANRIASRWASRTFAAFPVTEGLAGAEWVGNPIRAELAGFDRPALREEALAHFTLDPERPVLGVFGGSLGAGVLNAAVASMVRDWAGLPFQLLHLTGQSHLEELLAAEAVPGIHWVRLSFEDRMELFYAAVDLVIARAGGSVAEITATSTPAILVPGRFGSSGHQPANARFLSEAGAARILDEEELAGLPELVSSLLFDRDALAGMAGGAERIARPHAATTIARAMSGAG